MFSAAFSLEGFRLFKLFTYLIFSCLKYRHHAYALRHGREKERHHYACPYVLRAQNILVLDYAQNWDGKIRVHDVDEAEMGVAS